MKDIRKIIETHDQAIREGRERGVLVSAEMLLELAGQPVEDEVAQPTPQEPEDHDEKKGKKGK
jgi:hypothetical protein